MSYSSVNRQANMGFEVQPRQASSTDSLLDLIQLGGVDHEHSFPQAHQVISRLLVQ